jgi:hypothetical protein
MSNAKLLQIAKDAIDKCYGDDSVGIEKAKENMEELKAHCQANAEAAQADITSNGLDEENSNEY